MPQRARTIRRSDFATDLLQWVGIILIGLSLVLVIALVLLQAWTG
jgi:hypothetical protein